MTISPTNEQHDLLLALVGRHLEEARRYFRPAEDEALELLRAVNNFEEA